MKVTVANQLSNVLYEIIEKLRASGTWENPESGRNNQILETVGGRKRTIKTKRKVELSGRLQADASDNERNTRGR